MDMLLVEVELNQEQGTCQIAPNAVQIDDEKDRQEQYRKLLDCTRVEIVLEKIHGKEYCVLSDMYGREAGKRPSYVCGDGEHVCFGSVLFGNVGKQGVEAGITEEDVRILARALYDSVKKLSTLQELETQQEQGSFLDLHGKAED